MVGMRGTSFKKRGWMMKIAGRLKLSVAYGSTFFFNHCAYMFQSSMYNHNPAQHIPITNRCDVLRDLVPFVQFKKREKHPRRSATFSKVEGFTDWFFENLSFCKIYVAKFQLCLFKSLLHIKSLKTIKLKTHIFILRLWKSMVFWYYQGVS